jgi:glutamate-ammonia-ligase adenylyltransferase
MSNHQFFNKLSELFIAEVSRLALEGALYRIDLRLRPEGDSGPLSRSLSSYENYYAQWGQTWERMMLIKARCVGGDEALGAEFLEMIQPFRYPRSVSEGVLHEVAAMKDRIENEVVKAGELDRNVKLGRGGIREIEFIAQSQQLLHGGRQPFLQGAQTLPCLEKLVQYEKLTAGECGKLSIAYHFLRNVEHRLQMNENLQTHTIPVARPARERLARLMKFDNADGFEAARSEHCHQVRRIFERIFKSNSTKAASAGSLPDRFEGFDHEWKLLLLKHQFRDLDRAFRVLREFVEGPGYVHVSARTSDLALKLIPRLFGLCPGAREGGQATGNSQPAVPGGLLGGSVSAPLSDPDRVVTRLDSFIAAYGARSTLFELWNSNPGIFELLALLFDRSEFLAELAIRTPDLVDELVMSGRLRQRKSAEETLADLRHGRGDADQHLWLRRYHQAELMRIGLRDILGLADPEQYLTELSALADACLQYAMEVVMSKHGLKIAPFVIIGLGKLGGAEIDYGSDLDILFVADSKARNLPGLTRIALEVTDLVSARTEQGILFHTDARLRPDGEKGLLVNTLKAYEDYYRQRALLWEIQSLSRTRPVAGSEPVGAAFQAMAAVLTNFKQPSLPLSAFAPNWKDTIRQMRLRIEKERTPGGKDHLAIKTGAGGLMDAEFLAQALCLENGWREANTLKALEKGRDSGALAGADRLIESYRAIRRIEGILRRWSYEGETVLPDDPAPYYRVAIRCGFSTPEAFRESLAASRQAVRAAYDRFF